MDVDYNCSAYDNSCSSDDRQTDVVEQLNRNIFIKLFKDKKKYPNANSIAISEKLSWNREKLFRIYSYYSEKREFPRDKRRESEPPKRKMRSEYTDAILELLREDTDLKIPQMANFLQKKY